MVEARVVALGKLVAGHGVRGLARVKPFNPDSPTLRSCAAAWLHRPADGHRERLGIRECRPHHRVFLIAFEGIDSLDALEPWIGSLIEVESQTLPALAQDELYHHEAVGLTVRTTGGELVGTVAEVMALPANDVWVVRCAAPAGGASEREVLIPVVSAIVTRIDLAERVAVVDPIPGLLES